MTSILKKVINQKHEYNVSWWSWGGWEAHEFITQADYDLLTPAQKSEKVYMIKESGTPSTVLTAGAGIDISNDEISADMSTAVYDNTTSGATATNVQDAIDEVFQSVSNGKELLADAITDKGVQTSATDSFQTMASNISSLDIATEGQIVAYNMAHSWKWNLLFSIAWWQDHLSTWQQLLLYNGIWWSDYEMYFIWLTTTYSSSKNYECTWYKFFKDWTYTNTNVSTWASVSDNNNRWGPDWSNWYIVSDERYRYAFVKRNEDSYQSIAKFDTQTWTLTSDTTVTVNNSWRTLANIKTVLPYTVTSYTTSISVDIHAYDIVAKF